MKKNEYISNLYNKRDEFILIGLTGRTGAGCTTTAKILSSEKFEDLDLRSYKTCGFNNSDERKYSFIYRFMKEGKRWKKFDVIEASSIILSFVLEDTYKRFFEYLDSIEEQNSLKSFNDIAKRELYSKLSGKEKENFEEGLEDTIVPELKGIFDENKDNESPEVQIKTILEQTNDKKRIIKDYLQNYSIKIIEDNKEKETSDKKDISYNYYVYFMQMIGNNIRSSGDYDDKTCIPGKETIVAERIDKVIDLIIKRDKEKEEKRTRICIDALRNSVEIFYFRDRYRAFYAFAVNTEDNDRLNRLGINKKELSGLDKVEYPNKYEFYHQNIQACLEIADVYLYNPDTYDHKKYILTEQLLKYIALMLQPGLVAPTHLERCMQLAFNAKYNSGCISRKVGAVVTGSDFSIRSVGWNDVPKGQVACNLRCVEDYCRNKDDETFSNYELTEASFDEIIRKINSQIDEKHDTGKYFSYCFKDVKNGKKEKNQVHTRSLHAEENAFLQIAKYGGASIQGGKLFTTASPCELCAKKAYQLGISEIYYIDPYPGLSAKHILSFGKSGNPKMILFKGAIGNAYISMYSSRIPYKDELEMITGINVKEISDSVKKMNEQK